MTDQAVACSRCGRDRAADTDRVRVLAWVFAKEDGADRWICPVCARRHVRDIEANLPGDYW